MFLGEDFGKKIRKDASFFAYKGFFRANQTLWIIDPYPNFNCLKDGVWVINCEEVNKHGASTFNPSGEEV